MSQLNVRELSLLHPGVRKETLKELSHGVLSYFSHVQNNL